MSNRDILEITTVFAYPESTSGAYSPTLYLAKCDDGSWKRFDKSERTGFITDGMGKQVATTHRLSLSEGDGSQKKDVSSEYMLEVNATDFMALYNNKAQHPVSIPNDIVIKLIQATVMSKQLPPAMSESQPPE